MTSTAVEWIDLDNPQRQELMNLGIHPLVIDDIMNGGQRTKVEHYQNGVFFVFYRFQFATQHVARVEMTPIYIMVTPQRILTIHHGALDVIAEAKQRWNHRSQQPNADYGQLLHAILDTIVDSYFPLIDVIGDHVEQVESDILAGQQMQQWPRLIQLKRSLLELRRHVVPSREALNVVLRGDVLPIDTLTATYMQDVYDHVLRIIDAIDLHRDLLAAVLDVHLSMQSNRLNEIMKVMTVASIILMVNALIAGIYGMNFAHMPELSWPWGYPLVLAGMVLVSVVLLGLFYRWGWLRRIDV
jgi:magnesium transporter